MKILPKKINKPETIPSFMKGFIALMFSLITVLGYLILRSDPVIYSNNIEKSNDTVRQVQAFAAFIKTQPQLVKQPSRLPVPVVPAAGMNPSVDAPPAVFTAQQKETAREMVADLTDIWAQHPPQFDQQWRNQVSKLIDVIEQSGSEEALDLVQSQILAGRVHSDDLNREQSDRWLTRYMGLEKRESKLREMSDDYKEKVESRVDQDERLLRERANEAR